MQLENRATDYADLFITSEEKECEKNLEVLVAIAELMNIGLIAEEVDANGLSRFRLTQKRL